MKIRVAQATTIVLFALVMGVFWGTWFSLSRTMDRLAPETFLAVGHQMIQNLGVPMAILLPLALLSALGTLVLVGRSDRGAAFWWLLAGFLLLVAALVVTLAVEVPIDNQSIAAVIAVTVSGVVTARPTNAPRHVNPRDRAASPPRAGSSTATGTRCSWRRRCPTATGRPAVRVG